MIVIISCHINCDYNVDIRGTFNKNIWGIIDMPIQLNCIELIVTAWINFFRFSSDFYRYLKIWKIYIFLCDVLNYQWTQTGIVDVILDENDFFSLQTIMIITIFRSSFHISAVVSAHILAVPCGTVTSNIRRRLFMSYTFISSIVAQMFHVSVS